LFAPTETNVKCGSIINQKDFDDAPEVAGQSFECIRFEANNVTQVDNFGYRFCELNVTCKAFKEFSGINSVKLRFPDALQNIQWRIVPDVWSDTSDENAVVGHILSPNNIADPAKLKNYKEKSTDKTQTKVPDEMKWKVNKQNQLAGTSSNPTTVTFGVTRSKYEEAYGAAKNFTNWGLQMSFLNEKKVEEQGSGTPKGSHVVEFLFDVQESIYKSEWTVDNSIISKFGTVVSFLLSIIAFLKIAKLVLEKIIDTTLIKRAKKNKREAPLDVKLRQATLVEDREDEIKTIMSSVERRASQFQLGTKPSLFTSMTADIDTSSGDVELVEVVGHSAVEEEEEQEEEMITKDMSEVHKTIEVTIPHGTKPGNTVTVNLPDGREIHITVPHGMHAGNIMTINYDEHGKHHVKKTDEQQEEKVEGVHDVHEEPHEVEVAENVHTRVATLTTTVASLSSELLELKELMRTLLPSTEPAPPPAGDGFENVGSNQ